MERAGSLLLVEDEHSLRFLVAAFLRAEGYQVVEASDGREAIERLEDPISPTFDLAMVDLNLPEIHGLEVCRLARQIDPGLPLLVCSAAVVSEHATALQELGIHRYLTKPYHPSLLLRELSSLKRIAPPSRRPDRANGSAMAPTCSSSWPVH